VIGILPEIVLFRFGAEFFKAFFLIFNVKDILEVLIFSD